MAIRGAALQEAIGTPMASFTMNRGEGIGFNGLTGVTSHDATLAALDNKGSAGPLMQP